MRQCTYRCMPIIRFAKRQRRPLLSNVKLSLGRNNVFLAYPTHSHFLTQVCSSDQKLNCSIDLPKSLVLFFKIHQHSLNNQKDLLENQRKAWNFQLFYGYNKRKYGNLKIASVPGLHATVDQTRFHCERLGKFKRVNLRRSTARRWI